MTRIATLLVCSAMAVACGGDPVESGGPTQGNGSGNAVNGGGTGSGTAGSGSSSGGTPAEVATLSAQATETYLGKLAPPVVGRVLNQGERASILAKGGTAIEPIVAAWLAEPGFAKAARRFVELGLQVSGQKSGVDFDLPGNLVEYVVSNSRPWSEVLTAQTCYDASLAPIPCDTGAPYTAGVLTTRAYLISRASRFNLTRSSALMKNFACQIYPQAPELQPPIDKPRLIPMFQAATPEEQTEEKAKSGFGNGHGCYSCHSQFSLHAQLYVKFNSHGQWIATADGHQDNGPAAELGRSVDGLMASHLKDPTEAASERSDMFGKSVENLKEAAAVVATQATFAPCAAQRFLDFALGVNGAIEYDPRIFEEVVLGAPADPTLQQIVQELLTHPVVIGSVATSLTGAPG